MNRIAPRQLLPRFYVECGYMNDFSAAWKLGEMTVGLCAGWYTHRPALQKFTGWNPRESEKVRNCLEFMDALIVSWLEQLSGEEPELPLDDNRIQLLRYHRQNLESIRGEGQIWY